MDAAHDEAYVQLTKGELAWPAMRGALDELEVWAGRTTAGRWRRFARC